MAEEAKEETAERYFREQSGEDATLADTLFGDANVRNKTEALFAVYKDAYEIPPKAIAAFMKIVATHRRRSSLYALISEVVETLEGFTIMGAPCGSSKWIDVMVHASQRIFKQPKLSLDNFVDTCLPALCMVPKEEEGAVSEPEAEEAKEAAAENRSKLANICRESYLRTVRDAENVDQLLNLDAEFRAKHEKEELDDDLWSIAQEAFVLAAEASPEGEPKAAGNTTGEEEEEAGTGSDESEEVKADLKAEVQRIVNELKELLGGESFSQDQRTRLRDQLETVEGAEGTDPAKMKTAYLELLDAYDDYKREVDEFAMPEDVAALTVEKETREADLEDFKKLKKLLESGLEEAVVVQEEETDEGAAPPPQRFEFLTETDRPSSIDKLARKLRFSSIGTA